MLRNVGLPDKFDIRPSNRLRMSNTNQRIPPDTTTLGAYATPDFNTSMSLSKLLFRLIFTASKAQVARLNCAGQANEVISYVYKSKLGSHIIVVTAFLRTFNIAKTCPKRHKTCPKTRPEIRSCLKG